MGSGQRSRLYHEVNDRIYELLESADPDLPGEFVCECGGDCRRRVMLLATTFAALRQAGEAVRSPDCPTVGADHSLSADGVPALG